MLFCSVPEIAGEQEELQQHGVTMEYDSCMEGPVRAAPQPSVQNFSPTAQPGASDPPDAS